MNKSLTALGTLVGGVAGVLIGGLIGFLVSRLLVESFQVVEGPPAGVLFVLLVGSLGLVGGMVGSLLCLRWLRSRGTGAA